MRQISRGGGKGKKKYGDEGDRHGSKKAKMTERERALDRNKTGAESKDQSRDGHIPKFECTESDTRNAAKDRNAAVDRWRN